MSDEDIEEGESFIDNSSLNLLIKVTSSLVVLLSVLIISLWAVYQTAEVTFGGPPSSLELWEDEYREMTGLDRVDGFEGSGVKICIVDTGIDMSHPDLEDANIIGWNDLISGSDSPYDDEGHGTAMVGIIASKGGLNGVSPEADLLIAKAISDDGSGTDSTIADAVDWCVNGGADIISLSLGGNQGFGSGFFTTDQLEESVQEAIDLGVYVVAAAGNDGEDDDGDVESPGSVEDVICVGAVTRTSSIWSGSSVGDNNGRLWPNPILPRQDPDKKPEIVAPGHEVPILMAQSTGSGTWWGWSSGTSAATAWVSGSIAIFLEANPEMKRDGAQGGVSAISNLKMIISQNSEMKNGQEDHDDHYGYGLLRIDLLINETQNSSSDSGLLGSGFSELEDIQDKYVQAVQVTRRMMASVPPDNSTKETE
ncbi:MAG: S8 family serine peptidase [Candidatus Thermoplasmatota archaeon]|nr:S8 family serine peptidase [Candidatus Thermoplasmatota archaeon]